jgi:hypothetical protein
VFFFSLFFVQLLFTGKYNKIIFLARGSWLWLQVRVNLNTRSRFVIFVILMKFGPLAGSDWNNIISLYNLNSQVSLTFLSSSFSNLSV